jgi:ribosomal protein L11 methyltransferase
MPPDPAGAHPEGTVWRITAVAPPEPIRAAEAALEPFCSALTIFETAPDSGLWRLEGYADSEPDLDRLNGAVALMAEIHETPTVRLSVEAVAPRDWVAENLETFAPIAVGRYYVYGSHVEGRPPYGAVALRVDPGAAFGSGRHESTAGCLAAFDRLARRKRFRRMLDMGCGSGILALAMAKTWGHRARRRIVAADMDARAVRITRENARLNGEAARIRAVSSAGYAAAAVKRGGPYDLIVANILARPLVKMAAQARRNLAVGGYLVLAGLLTRDWRYVYGAHRMQGLRLVDRIAVGDWSTLVFKR